VLTPSAADVGAGGDSGELAARLFLGRCEVVNAAASGTAAVAVATTSAAAAVADDAILIALL